MKDFAALFPGQGSQSVGMGYALSQAFPSAAELFQQADEALGYSLSKLCFEGPLETLTLTENAQPAILVCSYAAYVTSGLHPIAAAGHSLGEYTALVAAGSLQFADAVKLVHKRGRYMQEAVKPGAGRMIAVLGPSVQEIEEVLGTISTGVAEVANVNCPGQTVLAGDVVGIEAAGSALTTKGGKVIPLNVSAPFHCSLMKPAADKLATDLDQTKFGDPSFPIYANVTASAVRTGAEAREMLKRQVCASVLWTDSMNQMVAELGITTTVEFGSGGVLSNLLKRIRKEIVRLEVSDAASLEKTTASLNS